MVEITIVINLTNVDQNAPPQDHMLISGHGISCMEQVFNLRILDKSCQLFFFFNFARTKILPFVKHDFKKVFQLIELNNFE